MTIYHVKYRYTVFSPNLAISSLQDGAINKNVLFWPIFSIFEEMASFWALDGNIFLSPSKFRKIAISRPSFEKISFLSQNPGNLIK